MILKKILFDYIQGEEPELPRREVQEKANKLARVVEEYLTADNTVSMTTFEFKNKLRMVKEEAFEEVRIDLLTIITYARGEAVGTNSEMVMLANELLEKINPKPL